MRCVAQPILASLTLTLAACGAGGNLTTLDVPWNAKLEASAAAYKDLGWKAPADGTLYLVDRSENSQVLGVYSVQAEQVFTFTPRLGRAEIEDRPVELKQRPKFGHEHEIYFVPR